MHELRAHHRRNGKPMGPHGNPLKEGFESDKGRLPIKDDGITAKRAIVGKKRGRKAKAGE